MGGGSSKKSPHDTIEEKPSPTRPRSDSQETHDSPELGAAVARVQETLGRTQFTTTEIRSALRDSLNNPEMAVMVLLEANDAVNEDLNQSRQLLRDIEERKVSEEEVEESVDDIFARADDLTTGASKEDDSSDSDNADDLFELLEAADDPEFDTVSQIPISSIPIIDFQFQVLENATENWNEKTHLLSQDGSFGKVFKGKIQHSDHTNGEVYDIAVRMLPEDTEMTDDEFKIEMKILAGLHDHYIVKMLGYSVNIDKCVVTLLMSNGTLNEHLSGKRQEHFPLLWLQRIDIVTGVARGLDFLHEEMTLHSVHRDIITANIFLDHHMEAKIGGFGIFRKLDKLDREEDLQNESGESDGGSGGGGGGSGGGGSGGGGSGGGGSGSGGGSGGGGGGSGGGGSGGGGTSDNGRENDEKVNDLEDESKSAPSSSSSTTTSSTTTNRTPPPDRSWGYLCPHYARTGQLSPTADIFSFGVCLLEALTGRPAVDDSSKRHPQDLVSQVEDDLYEVSSVQRIMDPLMPKIGTKNLWPVSNIMEFAQVCSQCVEPRIRKRPSMLAVRESLEKILHEALAWEERFIEHSDKSSPSYSLTPVSPIAIDRAEEWDQMIMEAGEPSTLGRDCGFECPITSELMYDPIIADDGHSYERTAIESWFSAGNSTSPVTGQKLDSLVLRSNHALRSAIQSKFMQLQRSLIEGKEAQARLELNASVEGKEETKEQQHTERKDGTGEDAEEEIEEKKSETRNSSLSPPRNSQKQISIVGSPDSVTNIFMNNEQ